MLKSCHKTLIVVLFSLLACPNFAQTEKKFQLKCKELTATFMFTEQNIADLYKQDASTYFYTFYYQLQNSRAFYAVPFLTEMDTHKRENNWEKLFEKGIFLNMSVENGILDLPYFNKHPFRYQFTENDIGYNYSFNQYLLNLSNINDSACHCITSAAIYPQIIPYDSDPKYKYHLPATRYWRKQMGGRRLTYTQFNAKITYLSPGHYVQVIVPNYKWRWWMSKHKRFRRVDTQLYYILNVAYSEQIEK